MKRYLIISLIIFSGFLGKSVAAQQPSFNSFNLLVGGERIHNLDPKQIDSERLLQNPTIKIATKALEDVLKGTAYESFSLQDKAGRDNLRRLLSDANIERGMIREPFTGFSGFSTILAFQSMLDLFDGRLIKPPVVKGRIREFLYDNDLKVGHLTVEMRIDHFDLNDVLHEREILHWDVEVRYGGYMVVKREGDRDNVPGPGRIFPGTIPLPRHARNPVDQRSVWVRGLDHKLFVRGKTNDGKYFIKVENVYRKINDKPIRRLPDSHAYYRIDDNSCIDIMFAGFPPAMQLPPQIGYCLGRCEKPYIVNTD